MNRIFPNNPNCPLSDKEKEQLTKYLDDLEWEAYAPIKHLTSAYASASVTNYDEFEISIELESGVDGDGRHDTEPITIERVELLNLV